MTSPSYEDLLYETKDHVATITMNRPKVYNAFRARTCEELIDAFQVEAEDDETGIKKVEVRINGGPFLPATQVSDDEWEFKVTLEPGKYKATAKATDLVDNMSRDSVKFKVVEDGDDDD